MEMHTRRCDPPKTPPRILHPLPIEHTQSLLATPSSHRYAAFSNSPAHARKRPRSPSAVPDRDVSSSSNSNSSGGLSLDDARSCPNLWKTPQKPRPNFKQLSTPFRQHRSPKFADTAEELEFWSTPQTKRLAVMDSPSSASPFPLHVHHNYHQQHSANNHHHSTNNQHHHDHDPEQHSLATLLPHDSAQASSLRPVPATPIRSFFQSSSFQSLDLTSPIKPPSLFASPRTMASAPKTPSTARSLASIHSRLSASKRRLPEAENPRKHASEEAVQVPNLTHCSSMSTTSSTDALSPASRAEASLSPFDNDPDTSQVLSAPATTYSFLHNLPKPDQLPFVLAQQTTPTKGQAIVREPSGTVPYSPFHRSASRTPTSACVSPSPLTRFFTHQSGSHSMLPPPSPSKRQSLRQCRNPKLEALSSATSRDLFKSQNSPLIPPRTRPEPGHDAGAGSAAGEISRHRIQNKTHDWASLDAELMSKIGAYLDDPSARRCQSVCRRWAEGFRAQPPSPI
ncbi:uncharacterized protein BJ171DRAFT_566074 [Polychytrium aggregatum]|uniref:uncharacterized protein n=1 Tax=Polychytrium aggregatum TaxID=110093 RepID=UPI0022FEE388|nr:uncharacterized protein BJ171DRAFT_566074 [Polychytrium aggregatum]KAI9207259.1 hypothetical protein BJ171DRAFT_566074 [Polychytrium aggregatum]